MGCTGEAARGSFQQAAMFYKMTLRSLRIVASSCTVEDAKVQEGDMILLLSALNNLGCIFANSYYDARRARTCLAEMKNILAEAEHQNMASEECYHFYQTIVLCQSQSRLLLPLAAAAA